MYWARHTRTAQRRSGNPSSGREGEDGRRTDGHSPRPPVYTCIYKTLVLCANPRRPPPPPSPPLPTRRPDERKKNTTRKGKFARGAKTKHSQRTRIRCRGTCQGRPNDLRVRLTSTLSPPPQVKLLLSVLLQDEYYLGAVHARRHVYKPDVRRKPAKKKSLSVQ